MTPFLDRAYDAPIGRCDVQFEAVPMEQVMAAVDGAKRLRMVYAYRDNPLVH
jgi:hypothetical protein